MPNNEIDNLKKKIVSDVSRVVTDTALYIESTTKLTIKNSPRGGRQYGKHKASAPGEPPATDTSNLINSVQVTDIINGKKVFVGAEYAEGLEIGTKKVAPRPFFKQSVYKGKKFFESRLNRLGK